MQNTQSRLQLIAKRDFTTKDIDDDDDDESGNEGYNIDASGQMWQAVNFDIGRGKANVNAKASLNADAKDDDNQSKRKHKKQSKSNGRKLQQDGEIEPLELMMTASGKHLPSLGTLDRKTSINNFRDKDFDIINKSVKDNRTLLSRLDGPVPNMSEEEMAVQRTLEIRKVQEDSIAKEKEQMLVMMEEIKRQRLELEEMTKRKEKEKVQEKEMAFREREELRIALETMRAQNQILVTQMKQSSEDAKLEIEQERKERAREVYEIEQQNKLLHQQVLEKQAEAERKLAAERDELKNALKRMESEKLEMSTKIYETELASKKGAEVIEAQRLEFASALKGMENEKHSLQKLVKENEAKAKNASDSVALQLAKEKKELEQKLSLMDREKKHLAEELTAKEAEARNHAKELAARLEKEKLALQESTVRMEQEKMSLAKALADAENEARRQAGVVSQQLEKEQKELEATEARMRREQEALERQLRDHREESIKSNAVMTEEMKKERAALEAHLAAVRKEKEEMEAAMKKSAEESLRREKEAADRLAKERDELREAVERMKIEMDLEKKRMESALVAKDNNVLKSKSGLKLTASDKSLYNILEEGEEGEGSSGQKVHRSSRQMVANSSKKSLKHLPIKERNEESPRSKAVINGCGEEDYDDFVDDVCEDEYGDDSEPEEDDEFGHLPAPHAAAAKGDLDHLKKLSKMEPSLIGSLDSTGRCPLFYAMAYNNVNVVQYILDVFPECVQQTDIHGDTPLHAGCSSGSTDCIQLLVAKLESVGEDLNIANSMGMCPMHLAQNSDVMSILYSANANLKSVDNNNRSPLFVSAAMNRISCVEFLLDCLDGDDEALYMIDSRGDTPLHAAACNGASESLLLLLQCGITPLMTNNKGLKAIDLAQKNKHKKCREILAQYHLHFATTSDFDSVLFIATLEGHKKIRESLQTGLHSGDEEAYNIIRKQFPKGERDNASDEQMKDKMKNLFSLNSNKSLRLKRYGSWIAYEDQTTVSDSSNIYWYNHGTGAGQWEVPESVVPLVGGKTGTLKSKSSSKQLLRISSKASMRLKRVGDWIQYCTEGGQTFYYNDKNGDFQWINPEKAKDVDKQMMEKAKEEEWVAYKDPDSGCVFWYNQKTHVSQWECPLQPGSAGYIEQNDYHNDNDADDLVEVHDDDDLGI